MSPPRFLLRTLIAALVLGAGCIKEHPDEPHRNLPPKTFMWLFPDSSIAEGTSRQHVRWWGEDPDGVIKGFLFTFDKKVAGTLPPLMSDTVPWIWTAKNDTVVTFPLLVRRDTFDVAVRAVDNSWQVTLPEHAVVRLGTSPFWDSNDNGLFDGADMELPTLRDAMDLQGAALGIPVLNQPPTVVFAQNPNDPAFVMKQPETTFTAATFAWVGTDPDGDQTITDYEIALNDTSDPLRWFVVSGNIRLISLVVPRERSDTAGSEVVADLYTGRFSTTRHFIGQLSHLRLDSLNTFYIRARDVAGDVSPIIQLPGAADRWYVKKPVGKILIISDYISRDSTTALQFYQSTLAQIPGFDKSEVLNIGRGLTAQQKKDSRTGILVPPFIDPAFVYTLHLFDAVFWYTDQLPSLAVAQYPLFQYVRDASHHGKVIFTTTFESSSDPRGALKDFAPIDSVSSVDLGVSRLLPTLGDTRLPAGYLLYPDSSEPANIYPALRFNSTQANFTVFFRPIYRRADAKYIYHLQPDALNPKRYVYSSVISDLRAISAIGSDVWACGANGVILHSSDRGVTWKTQRSGTSVTLSAARFLDGNTGLAVGDGGTILITQNGGSTWGNASILKSENLASIDFSSSTTGVIVGTNGLLIRTTNGGTTWTSPSRRTAKNLNSVQFIDQSLGVAAGDSGTVVKTTDGGASWILIPGITSRNLANVRFASPSVLTAIGQSGVLLRSTDSGDSWTTQSSFTAADIRGLVFVDQNVGYITGANGLIFQTQDGGISWTPQLSGIERINLNGQLLNGILFPTPTQGICVATGGIIIVTNDGGLTWSTAPSGNLDVGVIDGIGTDGKRSFAFLSLPLHFLNGDGTNVQLFLEKVLRQEFGL